MSFCVSSCGTGRVFAYVEDQRDGEQRAGRDEDRLLEAAIEARAPGRGWRSVRAAPGGGASGGRLLRGGLAGAIGAAVERNLLHREPGAGLNAFSNVNMRAPEAHGEAPGPRPCIGIATRA